MKPGIRCATCRVEFQEDVPLVAYCSTVRVIIAKTNESTDYDLCGICTARLTSEITGETWNQQANLQEK